jgi:hypothetical protein
MEIEAVVAATLLTEGEDANAKVGAYDLLSLPRLDE